jgi:RNA polymerase sigma-70 factor (ECF subfamily)
VPDDAGLAARLRAGDDGAWDVVLAEYGPRLLAVARRMMATEDDAQEALQDAFLSAYKAIGRFDGASLLSTWLHRIVVNACLMKLRARRRRPETSIEALLPAYLDDGHRRDPGPAWNQPPESGIEASELRAMVRTAIDGLPEAYRVVLVLRDLEGLDTEETARVLELTPNAVKTRLHRARQALRTVLEPRMTDPARKDGR